MTIRCCAPAHVVDGPGEGLRNDAQSTGIDFLAPELGWCALDRAHMTSGRLLNVLYHAGV